MKTLRQKADGLIDFLANKELSFGCRIKDYDGEIREVLHHSFSKNYNKDKDKFPMNEEVVVFNEDYIKEPFRNGVYTDNYYGFQKDLLNKDVKILGHPVLIGDVLEKISVKTIITDPDNIDCGKSLDSSWVYRQELLEFWQDCGFTKSLNEIFAGKIGTKCSFNERFISDVHTCQEGATHTKEFINGDVQALFDFFWELFGAEVEKNFLTNKEK